MDMVERVARKLDPYIWGLADKGQATFGCDSMERTLFESRNQARVAIAEALNFTAENGMKAALLGEFFEYIGVNCTECGAQPDEDCDFCQGKGEARFQVPVTWETIKKIASVARVAALGLDRHKV